MAYLIDVDAKVPLATEHPYSLGKRICISDTGILFKAFMNLNDEIEIHRSLNQGQDWELVATIGAGNLYNGFYIATNPDGTKVCVGYSRQESDKLRASTYDLVVGDWEVYDKEFVISGIRTKIPVVYYDTNLGDFRLVSSIKTYSDYGGGAKFFQVNGDDVKYCGYYGFQGYDRWHSLSFHNNALGFWYRDDYSTDNNRTQVLLDCVGYELVEPEASNVRRSSIRIVRNLFYSNKVYILRHGAKFGDYSYKNLSLLNCTLSSNKINVDNSYDITTPVSLTDDDQIIAGHFDMGIDGAGNIYILYVKSIPNNYLFMRTFDTQTETLSDEIQLTDFKVLAPSILTASLPNSNKIYYTYIRDV